MIILYNEKGYLYVSEQPGKVLLRDDLDIVTNLCWHREDGPAKLHTSIGIEYWIRDKSYYENEYFKKIAK